MSRQSQVFVYFSVLGVTLGNCQWWLLSLIFVEFIITHKNLKKKGITINSGFLSSFSKLLVILH